MILLRCADAAPFVSDLRLNLLPHEFRTMSVIKTAYIVFGAPTITDSDIAAVEKPNLISTHEIVKSAFLLTLINANARSGLKVEFSGMMHGPEGFENQEEELPLTS